MSSAKVPLAPAGVSPRRRQGGKAEGEVSDPSLASSEAPSSTTRGGPDEGQSGPPADHDAFLREVELLRDELTSRVERSTGPTTPSAPGRPSGAEGAGADAPGRWGKPSPFLEERVSLAQAASARLGEESRSLERQASSLRRELETLEGELRKISSELGFLRSEDDGEPPWAEGPPPTVDRSESDDTFSSPASGSYTDFTLGRYNGTVRDLHQRRRTLAWGTLALAAAISGVLLYLTMRAQEPFPPIWLAFLPLVWMVPVPFFIAAFRGTHRVLRQNQLELPEET